MFFIFNAAVYIGLNSNRKLFRRSEVFDNYWEEEAAIESRVEGGQVNMVGRIVRGKEDISIK